MAMLKIMLGAKWRWVTLFVLVLCGVFIRLGIWQIDRNAQRVAADKRIADSIAAAPTPLTLDMLRGDLIKLEYRAVTVVGAYDFANQIGLRNQVWNENAIGTRLLTPLVISGTQQAVLIDRGWLPLNESAVEKWQKFDEPVNAQVNGIIRISQTTGASDASGALKLWNLINLPRIAEQMPYPLLPVYIQQSPDRNAPQPVPGQMPPLPIRTEPVLAFSDGSNIAYASQWFMFAILSAVGYPFFIRHQEKKRKPTG